MPEIVEIPIVDLSPNQNAVLAQQGVPAGTPVRKDIGEICSRGIELLEETATVVAVTTDITLDEFAAVFEGEGRNEKETPVGDIFEEAEHLLLFAVTVGKATSSRIDELFEESEFALACMLDAAASVAADRAAEEIEHQFERTLSKKGWSTESGAALRYSPGYCGWHISGQRKLFHYLRPEQIGLTLRDSYLMEPLKSVSGVVLAGPREMHEFAPSFPSCAICETHSCLDRISALFSSKGLAE